MVKKINPQKDYYSMLDVNPNSTIKDIRKAHRRKVRATHPDCNGGREKGDIRSVNEAWDVLSNPETRGRYDDLRNGVNAEKRYDNEQRRREEEVRQQRAEEDRKEQEKQRREEEEILDFAKQAWVKLEPYIKKVPELDKKSFMAASFDELDPSGRRLMGKIYRGEGILFFEDFGVFDYFLNNLHPSKEELAEILKFTRRESQMQAIIPLKSNSIEGIKIKLGFTNAHKGYIYGNGAYLGIVDEHSLGSIYDIDRYNWLFNKETIGQFLPAPDFCNFSLNLVNSLKSGDYKIKLSQKRGKEDRDYSTQWHGYWIDDLVVGRVPIIQDRKSLVDIL